MKRGHFPIDSLPAWCLLNDVKFVDVKVQSIEGRGYGLVAEKELTNKDDNGTFTILKVPRDLVLSHEGVEEYAKENKIFRELVEAAGHQSTRHSILLFLLMQLVLSSPDHSGSGSHGASTPWTQYFSLFPDHILVPTMWSEREITHLKGTSLEAAVSAKLSVLSKEFDNIRAETESIPLWYEILTIDESITVRDWVWLDALYRSRSLELPRSGESLVPCLDLVNHSREHTAQFEENDKDEVVLLLRDGVHVSPGTEVTINYGGDKSAAEVLFSYGFIDEASTRQSLSLPLKLIDDDPLLKAKLHVFGKAPTLEIREDENGIPKWTAPFVYLMCLNEEDGIDFRILQETNGSQQLKMFWQGKDVTDVPSTFRDLISGHDLQHIFELRAVTIIIDMVHEQLGRLDIQDGGSDTLEIVRAETLHAAIQLRSIETDLLKRTLELLNIERDSLLAEESVLAYLGTTEAGESGEVADDKDFS